MCSEVLGIISDKVFRGTFLPVHSHVTLSHTSTFSSPNPEPTTSEEWVAV